MKQKSLFDENNTIVAKTAEETVKEGTAREAPNFLPKKPEEVVKPMSLNGLLYEYSAGREMDEGDKNSTEEYRGYYNGKMVALALEERNNSRIIAFPSVGGGDEWYKVGGNSALFYKYYIGPRMRHDPKFRSDTDLRHRFKYGVISLHWGEHFIEKMKKLGYTAKRAEYGLIICDLGRKFTAREVEEMRQKEKNDQDKVKRMIIPRENYPDIYGNLNMLARLLPPKVKKMDGAYRDVIGNEMIRVLVKLYEDYFKITNGHLSRNGADTVMLASVDELTAVLAIIDENNLLDLPTRTRLGTALVDLRNTINRRLGAEEVKKYI